MNEEIIKNCPERVLFTGGYFCRLTDGNTLCSDYTDCPYKQSQFLKRMNGEIIVDGVSYENGCFIPNHKRGSTAEISCLKQENERLKQENDKLRFPQKDLSYAVLSKEEFEDYQNLKQENETLKIECDMYKTYYRAKHDDIDGKIFKYKEALEEIRGVLELYANTWVNPLYYPNLNYDNTKAKEGLKMIDEVLDDKKVLNKEIRMRYRKKPVEIEAIQWTGDNASEIAKFTSTGNRYIEIDELSKVVRIETLEGIMTANLYDFIIRGVQGEFYPCKPDIFKQTYEVLDERN